MSKRNVPMKKQTHHLDSIFSKCLCRGQTIALIKVLLKTLQVSEIVMMSYLHCTYYISLLRLIFQRKKLYRRFKLMGKTQVAMTYRSYIFLQ